MSMHQAGRISFSLVRYPDRRSPVIVANHTDSSIHVPVVYLTKPKNVDQAAFDEFVNKGLSASVDLQKCPALYDWLMGGPQ